MEAMHYRLRRIYEMLPLVHQSSASAKVVWKHSTFEATAIDWSNSPARMSLGAFLQLYDIKCASRQNKDLWTTSCLPRLQGGLASLLTVRFGL